MCECNCNYCLEGNCGDCCFTAATCEIKCECEECQQYRCNNCDKDECECGE